MFALFTVLRMAGETLEVAAVLKMRPDSVLSLIESGTIASAKLSTSLSLLF
jgi:hypothetical protein